MLEVGEGASCFIDGGAKVSWLIMSVAIASSAGVLSLFPNESQERVERSLSLNTRIQMSLDLA